MFWCVKCYVHIFLQINALLAIYHSPNEETPECSGEVKEVLEQLKGKIDTAIAKYGEDKAFIKLNTHSARDAILDKSDDDHIQAVEVCYSLESFQLLFK